jgi:uncharacterized protein (DUF2062 family)
VTSWLKRRVLGPLLELLRQGTSPNRLALCVAIGVVIGNIPILGVSTILCAALALTFRLNLPAIQLIQAAMAPTQLLLIIPFVRLGEWLLGAPRQAVSLEAGLAVMREGIGSTVVVLREVILHASFAWCLIAPLATLLLYGFLSPMFKKAAAAGTSS